MMTQFCCGNVCYIINTSNRNHRSESALLLFFMVFKIRICREQIQQNRAKQTHVLFPSQDWMTLRFMTQNNERKSLPRSQSVREVYLWGTEEAYVTWDQYPNTSWYVCTPTQVLSFWRSTVDDTSVVQLQVKRHACAKGSTSTSLFSWPHQCNKLFKKFWTGLNKNCHHQINSQEQ